ncbi:nanos homolog 1 [Pelodytes ibericus]
MDPFLPSFNVYSCPDGLADELEFNAWNDYLGLSALIMAGLRHSTPKQKAKTLQGSAGPPDKSKVVGETQSCGFCRNNREAAEIYTTHCLKGPDGRILCPVLRMYTCPLCGANGDRAHTLRYCPVKRPMADLRWRPVNGCF